LKNKGPSKNKSGKRLSGDSELTTSLSKNGSEQRSALSQHTTSNSRLSALGIPSSFKVLGHIVRIKEIPDMSDVDKYGDWDQSKNEIRIFTEGVCDDVILHTYYHELMHCLFDRVGRHDLSGDETLVDNLGGLLAQVLPTQ
jgi:hypothetical protein